jgi:hypothetical protein
MAKADPTPTTTAPDARLLLETAVECLIGSLDLIDPDPDLEDNSDAEPSLGGGTGDDRELDTADDEPSLGSTDCLGHDSQEFTWGKNGATTDDREKTGYTTESDDEEPTLGWSANMDQGRLYSPAHDGDNEPSLGWTDMEARYGRYNEWAGSDREDEHDGSEPSLGWQNRGLRHTSSQAAMIVKSNAKTKALSVRTKALSMTAASHRVSLSLEALDYETGAARLTARQ